MSRKQHAITNKIRYCMYTVGNRPKLDYHQIVKNSEKLIYYRAKIRLCNIVIERLKPTAKCYI